VMRTHTPCQSAAVFGLSNARVFGGATSFRACARWPVCRRRGGCPCYAMMSCNVPVAGRTTVCRRDDCTPLLLINQSLAFPHASPYPATARLRACDRSRGSRSLLSLLCTSICPCVRVRTRMLCVLPLRPRQAISIMSR
jgi:hypothetical protein